MKIYLQTDMEGVSGITNFKDYCLPESRYHERGRELLTREINAVVEGFLCDGRHDILVADAHGPGGVDPVLLDERVELARGRTGRMCGFLDESFDFVAWVGQHAKAGTRCSHLTHTQYWDHADFRINGISVGEFGQLAACARELGVQALFAAGEGAFAREAANLIPGIVTVGTKRGISRSSGRDLSMDEYSKANLAAVHIHPNKARERLRKGAQKAIRSAKNLKNSGRGFFRIKPPYKIEADFRKQPGKPPLTFTATDKKSILDVIMKPYLT